jgi:lauroyl/myristoyl acyltransferase
MKLQDLYDSALGIGIVLWLAKITPPAVGYRLGAVLASWISSRKRSEGVMAVRANQWILSGKKKSAQELNELTARIFRFSSRAIYDFYHTLSQPNKTLNIVDLDEKIDYYFKEKDVHSAVFVAPHLSNFEIVGRALGLRGYPFQILSYPNPGSGYQWQNKIRAESGLDITPISIHSLQQARIRLEGGGSVLTGLDRPVDDNKYRPLFFGYPSSAPVFYTRIALQAKVPVVIVTALPRENGGYRLEISDPISMKSYPDLHTEYIRNTEAVLRVAEGYIRAYPDQWLMFYPVWPESLSEVPY